MSAKELVDILLMDEDRASLEEELRPLRGQGSLEDFFAALLSEPVESSTTMVHTWVDGLAQSGVERATIGTRINNFVGILDLAAECSEGLPDEFRESYVCAFAELGQAIFPLCEKYPRSRRLVAVPVEKD